MNKTSSLFAAIVCLLLFTLVIAEAADNPRVSSELISSQSDCANRERIQDDGGMKFLLRCLEGGIIAIALGIRPLEPDVYPSKCAVQDVIDAMYELGWDVQVGYAEGLPPEFNITIPVYIFYRSPNDCLPGNCTVPGDDPGSSAFLLPEAFQCPQVNWVPVGPDLDCFFDDPNIPDGPCWATLDCNGDPDYATCTADIGTDESPPVFPECDSCRPAAVGVETSTWGRIKSRYRDAGK